VTSQFSIVQRDLKIVQKKWLGVTGV